jgi:glycosyltransferase involved in cell wall biosynthesis
MSRLTVSVVIPSYSEKRSQDLLACIASLRHQSMPPNEIVVVLDRKVESTLTFLTLENVRVVVCKEEGVSSARNVGVNAASGDIVAFIDDDAIAERDWLKNLLSNYDDQYVVGVGGKIIPAWEKGRPTWFARELDWVVGCSYAGMPEKKTTMRNPIGCNMSFRRNVFKTIGYFRESIGRVGTRLVGSEEAELCIRLRSEAPEAKVVYDPSAVVLHKVAAERATIIYLVKRSFYEGLSKKLMNEMNLSKPQLMSTEMEYLDYMIRVSIPSRLRSICKSNIGQLLTLILSTFAVFAGYVAYPVYLKSRSDE